MKKILLCCTAVTLLLSNVKAGDADSLSTKAVSHYIGVQANQLLKQIINLNASSTPINNPYLLTYGIFSNEINWGLELGLGYNYTNTKDNLSPTDHETKLNQTFYRLGVARKFDIGKRWEAGIALDYAGSSEKNTTFSYSVTEFNGQKDSTSTLSDSNIKSSGGGLRTNIRFGLSKYIFLGTEMTFYYSKTKNKSDVTVTEVFSNVNFPGDDFAETSNSKSDLSEKSFVMTLPVAIFLIVKF